MNVCIHPRHNQCQGARCQHWRPWVLECSPVSEPGPNLISFWHINVAKWWAKSLVTRLWLLLRWPVLKQCTSLKKGCVDESPHISQPFCACLPTQATDGPYSDQKQECDWGRWPIWWWETFAFLPQHRDDCSDGTFYGQPCKEKQCDDLNFHTNLANAKTSWELELFATALSTMIAFIPKCWLFFIGICGRN